jgi:hypothetical protein
MKGRGKGTRPPPAQRKNRVFRTVSTHAYMPTSTTCVVTGESTTCILPTCLPTDLLGSSVSLSSRCSGACSLSHPLHRSLPSDCLVASRLLFSPYFLVPVLFSGGRRRPRQEGRRPLRPQHQRGVFAVAAATSSRRASAGLGGRAASVLRAVRAACQGDSWNWDRGE